MNRELTKIIAFETALKRRGCPPLSKKSGDEFEKHKEICQSCKHEKESADGSPWKALGVAVCEELPKISDELRVGQIRLINQKLSGWGSNRYYYKPPLVLLLADLPQANAYQVAQIYRDESLQGTDDIQLLGFGGFAEPWNVFTIHKEHLGKCYGEVSQELAATILDSFQNIQNIVHGDDADAAEVLELSIDKGSPINNFRSLEKLVASHFVKQSEALLIEEKAASVTIVETSMAKKIYHFKDIMLDWFSPPWSPELAGLLPTSTCFPEQQRVFKSNKGEIVITISWEAASNNRESYIHVEWERKFISSDYLWARFIDPDTEEIFSEFSLGEFEKGTKRCPSNKLGFDPTEAKWSVLIFLEKQSGKQD